MKTILEYIKENPVAFIGAADERSRTTPSHRNHKNHRMLIDLTKNKDWKAVETLINDADYWKPLEGVILVTDGHGLDHDDWLNAYDAYQDGKIS